MIKAKLTLYDIRKKPINSGYRPLFFIDDEYYSGAVFFDVGEILPQESYEVCIDFASFKGKLPHGRIIKILESPGNEIGEVLIIK
ncbi:hypothetical protein [Serratia sp. D1N4]